MAKTTAEDAPAGKTQVRYYATPRAIECLDFIRGRLHNVIERGAAANFINEKVSAFDVDLMEAMLFKDGRERELAMMQALRRKLATYDDDTSIDAEIGRAEAALAKLHKAVAKRDRPTK